MRGQIKMADDFEDPLPAELEAAFYGVAAEELRELVPPIRQSGRGCTKDGRRR